MADTLSKDDVETRPEQIYTEPGDHDHFTHYVDQRKFDLVQAMMDGTKVQAQCGVWFIPKRDITKYPICQTCKKIVDYRSRD